MLNAAITPPNPKNGKERERQGTICKHVLEDVEEERRARVLNA